MSITEVDDDRLTWVTSSYSNGAGGECVECAISTHRTLVRDSKVAGGHVIAVHSGAWRFFVQSLTGTGPLF